MRLLIYSQDGMGLGHLRRSRNIAHEVLARRPDSQILAIADAPDAPFFPRLAGMDFLKLPTIVKNGRAGWRTDSPSLDVDDVVGVRAQMMADALDDFAPDTILVDHMPAGAQGELKPLLDRALSRSERPRLILGLRDILDEPETIARAWTEVGAYDYLGQYDTVLIHGTRDVYDAEAAYGLRPRVRELYYNHYVAPSQPVEINDEPVSYEPFVLMMGGGGADAFPLARAFLDAMPLVLRSLPMRALVLTGPNMPAADRASLVATAAKGVEVRTSERDATALIRKASALVTMGGYNTLCEVLSLRKRAIVVPRSGPSAEQRMRSRLFAERGLIRLVEPEVLSAERLAEELLSLLKEDRALPNEAEIPPLDGAARAAGVIVGALTPA